MKETKETSGVKEESRESASFKIHRALNDAGLTHDERRKFLTQCGLSKTEIDKLIGEHEDPADY